MTEKTIKLSDYYYRKTEIDAFLNKTGTLPTTNGKSLNDILPTGLEIKKTISSGDLNNETEIGFYKLTNLSTLSHSPTSTEDYGIMEIVEYATNGTRVQIIYTLKQNEVSKIYHRKRWQNGTYENNWARVAGVDDLPTHTSDLINDGDDGTNVFVKNNDTRLSDSRIPKFTSISASESNPQNLNTDPYRTGGFYYMNSANNAKYVDNCPLPKESNQAFWLLVETWGTSNTKYVKQTLTYYNTGKTYIRVKNVNNDDPNTGWKTWKELVTDFEYIISTHESSTSAWTGTSQKFSSLYANTLILYHLKQAPTTDNVTLTLTLSDGTTTITKNVYYSIDDNLRLTNQYKKGEIIPLYYNGSQWIVASPYTNTIYTHPTPSALGGAKSNGLYKTTIDAQGHITAATAITIDNTATNNENNLITSQAVYNGLNGKQSKTISGASSQNVVTNANGEITTEAKLEAAITTPLVNSKTGDKGSSIKYAREDHSHPKYDYTSLSGTNNTYGYINLIKITINNGWVDKPIVIKTQHRDKIERSVIQIKFSNISDTDPSLQSITHTGQDMEFYLYKESTSNWILICGKGHNGKYDNVDMKIDNPNADISISKLGTHLATLPTSSITQSTYIGFTSTEKTKLAGIETGANAYTHPTPSALGGTKTEGLYKTAIDANGHITKATALTIDSSVNNNSNLVQGSGIKSYVDGQINSTLSGISNGTLGTHEHTASQVTDSNSYSNLGVTSTGQTQQTINGKINEKIGILQGTKFIEVGTKPTNASSETMNKLYIISEDNQVNVYYTKQNGSTYTWGLMDTDILDNLVLPTANTTTAGIIQIGTGALNAAAGNHKHGSITSDGKIGSDANKILMTGANGVIGTTSFGSSTTTTANYVVACNDTRLSNTRTPTDNTVTTAKIVDGNVTTAKLADSSVTSAKIADGTIVNGDIANTTIQGGKLVNGTITATQLASNAVETAKIKDANVTTAKIADANVTTAKIADSAVTSAKITDGTIVNGDIASNAAIAYSKLSGVASSSHTHNTLNVNAITCISNDSLGNYVESGWFKITNLHLCTDAPEYTTYAYLENKNWSNQTIIQMVYTLVNHVVSNIYYREKYNTATNTNWTEWSKISTTNDSLKSDFYITDNLELYIKADQYYRSYTDSTDPLDDLFVVTSTRADVSIDTTGLIVNSTTNAEKKIYFPAVNPQEMQFTYVNGVFRGWILSDNTETTVAWGDCQTATWGMTVNGGTRQTKNDVAPTNGDIIKIKIDSGKIYYYKNNVLLLSSNITLPEGEYFFGFYTNQDRNITIKDLKITSNNQSTYIKQKLSEVAASSHTHGNITNAGAIGSTANLPVITTTSGKLTTGSFEATATNIKMNGTQSVGLLNTFARADHVHPTDTSRAPTSHASTATTYGGGTASNYGHVKVSDNISSSAGNASQSVAASSKAVKDVYDIANPFKERYNGIDFLAGGNNIPKQYFRLCRIQYPNGTASSNVHLNFEILDKRNGVDYFHFDINGRYSYSNSTTVATNIKIHTIDCLNPSNLNKIYFCRYNEVKNSYIDVYFRIDGIESWHLNILDDHTTGGSYELFSPVREGNESYTYTSVNDWETDLNNAGKTINDDSSFVYTEITQGEYNLTVDKISINNGTNSQFLKANGDVDSNVYIHTAGTGMTKSNNTLGITNGGVGATQLASNAVETAKIKDANVTTAKIADGAVTNSKLSSTDISNVDLNTVVQTGFYYSNVSSSITNLVHAPGVQHPFTLHVIASASANNITQIFSYTSNSGIYIRRGSGINTTTNLPDWGEWERIDYVHPDSGVGAKSSNLYKTTINAQGHITAATAASTKQLTVTYTDGTSETWNVVVN